MSQGPKSGKKLPKAKPLAASSPAAPMAQPVPKVSPVGQVAKPEAPLAGVPRAEPSAGKEKRVVPRRPGQRSAAPAIIYSVLALVLLGAMGGAGAYLLTRQKPAITLQPIDSQTIDELKTLKVKVAASWKGQDDGSLVYSWASGAPPGATIDKQTGEISWTPSEAQGPGQYELAVRVESPGSSALAVIGRFTIQVDEVHQPPAVEEIPELVVRAGQKVAFPVRAKDLDLPQRPLTYRLAEGAPAGASLDAKTGLFQWTAPESGEPLYAFKMTVAKSEAGDVSTAKSFRIRVEREATPLERLVTQLSTPGATVSREGPESFAPFSGKCHVLKVDGARVHVLEYPSDSAADQEIRQVSPDAAMLFGKAKTWESQPHVYRKNALVAVYVGTNPKVTGPLEEFFGRAAAEGVIVVASTPMPKSEIPRPEASELKKLVDLYTTNKKLFVAKEYPELRKLFAERFEREHRQEIQAGLSGAQATITWLKDHPVLKEELYIAIDPAADKIPQVMALVRDLHKQFPNQLEHYWNLAIATAVTWDTPNAVYDFQQHQQRTKSKPGNEPMAGPMENFKYFLDQEKYMQGRARFLPWEMLVHLVNNKTPVQERLWAMTNYLPRRAMFGKCYQDVPYDMLMLDTGDRQCKLQNQLYTLPNVRQFGGVCAMQADFAARVGQSIGVPSEYVMGEAADGELHAWVMWVELQSVTEGSIAFSLESHGRYRGDKYYVGHLTDPRTGRPTTDRELELRLHTVGVSPLGKRQADLLMRAFPLLRNELKMDVEEQMLYLGKVMGISPGNEAAWLTMAGMSRDKVITAKQQPRLKQALESLFKTFANVPDFTWKIFDDLVSFYDKPKDKTDLYGRLIALYVTAGRPDLACEARLKFTDHLTSQDKAKDAVQGLAATIRAFPDEGRYVPKMLDKMEAIAKGLKDSAPLMAQFYQGFLPTVPQRRGDRASPYCIRMYERGIVRFKEAGQTALAQTYEGQLAKLRGGAAK